MTEHATLLLEDGAWVPEGLLARVDAIVETSSTSPICTVRGKDSKGIKAKTTAVLGGLFKQAEQVEAEFGKEGVDDG